MTPIPHKHAKEIHAFADGYEIQFRFSDNRPWGQCVDPSWHLDLQYRVKPAPVMAWYRVGEMKNGSIFLSCSGVTEAHFNNHKDFSRWLDERKEYDVTP